MTRKLKPVERELDKRAQEAVLGLPVQLEDGTLSTVGDLVESAADALRLANEAVQGNALVQMTAEHLMKQEKRRGTPSVLVRLDGTAVLVISYGDPVTAEQPEPKKLPSLDALRRRATDLEVDISDLGRKKRRIIKRLDEAEEKKRLAEESQNRSLVTLEDDTQVWRDETTESDMKRVALPQR